MKKILEDLEKKINKLDNSIESVKSDIKNSYLESQSRPSKVESFFERVEQRLESSHKKSEQRYNSFYPHLNGEKLTIETFENKDAYFDKIKSYIFSKYQHFQIGKIISIGSRTKKFISDVRNPVIELLIDETNQQFIILNLKSDSPEFENVCKFSDISDFQLDENRYTGAFGTEIKSLKINLQITGFGNVISIPFLTSPIGESVTGVFYTGRKAEADQVMAALTHMKKISEQGPRATHSQSKSSSTSSVADELRKFKQLMDEGIITFEDFEAKKKQLLDL